MAWGRGIFTLVKGLAESDPTVGLGFNRDCPQSLRLASGHPAQP